MRSTIPGFYTVMHKASPYSCNRPELFSFPCCEALACFPCFLHLEAHTSPVPVEFRPILEEVVQNSSVVFLGIWYDALSMSFWDFQY